MLQDFTDKSKPYECSSRVKRLRFLMADNNLDGYIIPHNDEFHNEYNPSANERLAWITGFPGSAGLAIVMTTNAALFVDGRYKDQAKNQTDLAVFDVIHTSDTDPLVWLREKLSSGERIGYDPALHSVKQLKNWLDFYSEMGVALIPVENNLIDQIWHDRPRLPASNCLDYPLEYAGEPRAQKIARLQQKIREKGHKALFLSGYDSIAWLFNLRASDIDFTPVLLGRAIVYTDRPPCLYLDINRFSAELLCELNNEICIVSPDHLTIDLKAIGAGGGKLLGDSNKIAADIAAIVITAGGHIIDAPDLVNQLKAIKNKTEIAWVRKIGIIDSAVICRFLAWIERSVLGGDDLDEITLAKTLNHMRSQAEGFRDISFPTISATGANAALPHYCVNHRSNTRLVNDNLYLVDSGGQYLGATTDITRTIAIGSPNKEMSTNFTLVLKGFIALSNTIFPVGTPCVQIDAFARAPLWQAGLNYDHGTGHGVGAYLSVHESPPTIDPKSTSTLAPGMLFTNEPGYYRPGAYGIRLEDMLLAVAVDDPNFQHSMLRFEKITTVPIDRRLIMVDMLTKNELDWLNDYHQQTKERLSPLLNRQERRWLDVACAPLVATH